MHITAEPIENSMEILDQIRALVTKDLAAVDHLISQELTSSVPLTCEITAHIFKGKGKRLRSLILILASHALSAKHALQTKHVELATVIEFVHTATLLHDDVVDHSNMRRGQQTANVTWGNPASVLVGDFLYSRAFQMLARHDHLDIMQVLSKTTNAIAEGELMQLMNQHDPDLTQDNYFHVITQKTAKLFAAATEIGAILAGANTSHRMAMHEYGLHLGIAFQMIDDLLDYQASAEVIGKNLGDDLAEGKATLPLICAMEKSTPEKALFIRNAIQQGNVDCLPEIISILKETNALVETKNKAFEQAKLANSALQSIPDSPYRQALADLGVFAVQRAY